MTAPESRYELGAEISRTESTVEHEGRDVRLARDVALRVPAGALDPEALGRFVAEVRIVGRLQHPGIPPVYELGVAPDGRPFVAGRRVRGRTLAEVLASPPGEGSARHRLLVAFERVCQTIAYVHAEGVSHGNLTAETICLGDEGEVQVVDWSQARRGEGFERDVRALGGLLQSVVRDVPGHEGLDILAARCRAAGVGDGSIRADAVAAGVAAHLAAAKDRARRLELEALAARAAADRAQERADEALAEAAGQRRRRRQTLALAAAGLCAVVVGVGGWRWIAEGRRDREDRARSAVQAALREAERLRGSGDHPEAAAAAARAADLALPTLEGTELADRATSLAADLARRARTECEDAERARLAQEKVRAAEEERIERALTAFEGAPPARADLARAAWDRPDDLWAHLAAARHALRVEPCDPACAVRHLTAAVALRPQSAGLLLHLADALDAAGRSDEAAATREHAGSLAGVTAPGR